MLNPFYLHRMYAFVNNGFLLQENATVPAGDLAVNRGYGIFDYLKVLHNRPVFANDHLNRFYFSAEQMRLPVSYTKDQLLAIINELIQKNDCATSGIRITLTGGVAADGYSIGIPNLILTQQLLTLPTQETFDKGISLHTYEHRRQLPQVKTIDYLMPIWLQPLVKQQGADDLLYHVGGIISECPRANVFLLTKEGSLVTPGDGILKGITRKHLLRLAAPHFTVEERTVTLEEMANAEEVLITSSTKGVLPVSSIDGKEIGNGNRDRTRHLDTLLNEAIQLSISG